MDGITRETFEAMLVDSKLNILFDLAQDQYKCFCKTEIQLTALDKRLNKRKKIDTTSATIAGFFGGIIAYLGDRIFKL